MKHLKMVRMLSNENYNYFTSIYYSFTTYLLTFDLLPPIYNIILIYFYLYM